MCLATAGSVVRGDGGEVGVQPAPATCWRTCAVQISAEEGLETTEPSSMLRAYLAFDWHIETFPSHSWYSDEALLFFQDWQPPFACDVDKLHFTPRIQRLNELEVNCKAEHCFCSKMFECVFEKWCFPVD